MKKNITVLSTLALSSIALALSSAFATPQISPQSIIVNPVPTDLSVNVSVDRAGSNPVYNIGDSIRVNVSVSDNGPGIPADLINRIFDPFVTTKPVGRGLGLGLSISYGIVQDFSGHIRASNRAEGGAELTIDLPVRVAKAISPVNAHA